MTEKKTSDYQIDNVDLEILSILLKNANTPYTEIAEKIIVSGGTIHVRMKKLIDAGIVKGSHLEINVNKLGFDICAFIGINLTKASFYDEVVKKLKKVNEIVELHYTTGKYSMFAKIICKSTQNLREVLNDKIQGIEGVQSTETILSLSEDISRPIQLTKE